MTVLWKLPPPPDGIVRGPFFAVRPNYQAELFIFMEDRGGVHYRLSLFFRGVQAFRFTDYLSATREMILTAFNKVVMVDGSDWLTQVWSVYRDKPNRTIPSLYHFIVFFDEEGCYEFLCNSFEAVQAPLTGSELTTS